MEQVTSARGFPGTDSRREVRQQKIDLNYSTTSCISRAGPALKMLIVCITKVSSNTQVVHGYEKQLPTYEKSERTNRSAYVIIRVAGSQSSIKKVQKLHDRAVKSGKKVPKVFVIDGRRKAPASKR